MCVYSYIHYYYYMVLLLQLTATIVDASAFQEADGTVTVVAVGGTAPYSYAWNTGAITPVLIATAGVYTVTVTDATGLVATEIYTIKQPLVFDVDAPLYDTALLSDNACRDLHCRQVITSGSATVGGRTNAVCNFALVQGFGLSNTTSLRSVREPDGSGGLYVAPYGSDALPKDVLHVTTSGVDIQGNLTVTGGTTQVVVNHIIVEDKTLTLTADATDTAALDQSGFVFGQNVRSLLYSASTDSFGLNANMYLPTNEVRFGGSAYAAATTTVGPSLLHCATAAGAIILDDFGFSLVNCKLVNPIAVTAQFMTDTGIEVASNHKTFGWSTSLSEWSTTDSLNAAAFTTVNGLSLSDTGLRFPIPSSAESIVLSTSGLALGSSISVTPSGVDLVDKNACVFFGNRTWRVRYDDSEESLSFEKRQADGTYTSKLVLD